MQQQTSPWKPVDEAETASPWTPVEEPPQPGAAQRFGSNLWNQVNPVNAVVGARDATAHPISTVKNDASARRAVYDKAEKSFKKGDYAGGAAHLVYSMLPLIGPQLDQAGEKFARGDIAGGAGMSTGIGLNLAAPAILKNVSPGKILYKTGQTLTDYAPGMGKAAGRTAEHGGVVGAAVSAMRGDAAGVAEGLAGSIAAPLIKSAVTKGVTKMGSGSKWLGNLLSADASGIQPLPMTKALLQKAGLYDRFLQSAEEQQESPQSSAYPRMDTAYAREPVANQGSGATQPSARKGGPLLLTGQTSSYPRMDSAYSRETVANQGQPGMQPSARQVQPRQGPLLLSGQTIGQVAPADMPMVHMADMTLDQVRQRTSVRTMSGESALNQILTGQDNANLIKIAKSRGIDVSKEVQLKAGKADALLIKKIADSFEPHELDEIGARYLDASQFKHGFGDIGPEAWKTMSMQTYFPDVKLAATTLKRTRLAIEGAKAAEPMSIVKLDDQPYFKAAENSLGKEATPEKVGQLARRLKDQDQDLAGVLEKNIQFFAAKKNGSPVESPTYSGVERRMPSRPSVPPSAQQMLDYYRADVAEQTKLMAQAQAEGDRQTAFALQKRIAESQRQLNQTLQQARGKGLAATQ